MTSICYVVKKIWFKNNYITSLEIIIVSQRIYKVIILICYVTEKIGHEKNNVTSLKNNVVKSK